MPLKKPDIRLPQKRYERLPDPEEDNTLEKTETTTPALVRCDITANPAAGTISVRHADADAGGIAAKKNKTGAREPNKKEKKNRQISSGVKNNTKHQSGKNETP